MTRVFGTCIRIWAGFSTLPLLPGGMGFARAQNSGFASTDLRSLREVGSVELSPDAQQAAYTVVIRSGNDRPSSEIRIVDLRTQTMTIVGVGWNPRWSPDGRSIAYLARVNNQFGLVRLTVGRATGDFLAPVKVTNHPFPSTGEQLSWSPDGRQLAFVSAVDAPENAGQSSDPVVIRRYLYKAEEGGSGTHLSDNRRLQIFVVDVATRAVRQLTTGSFSAHSIDWSPLGDEILFVSNREADFDRVFNYDVFAVRVSDGDERRLTRTNVAEYRPRWSPDAQRIAFQATKRPLTSSETTLEDTHVWIMNRDGSDAIEVGGGIDNRQGPPRWSADGGSLYFHVIERGSGRLYQQTISGGRAQAVAGEDGGVTSWSVVGNTIAYALHTPGDLPQLYTKVGGVPRQLTDLNSELRRTRRTAEVKELTFTSFDGLPVQAFVTMPIGWVANRKYPLVVRIHGGPHSMQTGFFDHKAQAYAAHGFATLMVNYRGSIGYGQRFIDAIIGDQNGAEAKDVLEGVRAALARFPMLDATKMAVEGTSYGGQLAAWLVTQTGQFQAAILSAPVVNLISFNYMAYYHDYLAVEFQAWPHESDVMDRLWNRSPLRYVARVRTPVMLVHGENDTNVPIAESEQFYIALKDVGVEAVFLRYPREGHGLAETGHVIDYINRSLAWYDKHFARSRGPEERPESAK